MAPMVAPGLCYVHFAVLAKAQILCILQVPMVSVRRVLEGQLVWSCGMRTPTASSVPIRREEEAAEGREQDDNMTGSAMPIEAIPPRFYDAIWQAQQEGWCKSGLLYRQLRLIRN